MKGGSAVRRALLSSDPESPLAALRAEHMELAQSVRLDAPFVACVLVGTWGAARTGRRSLVRCLSRAAGGEECGTKLVELEPDRGRWDVCEVEWGVDRFVVSLGFRAAL